MIIGIWNGTGFNLVKWASGLGILLALLGCTRSPLVSYYMLAPDGDTVPASPTVSITSVAVNTPVLPSYVNKDEIVERLPGDRVEIHEHQRWATDLDDMIRDFLIAALQRRVPEISVVSRDSKFSRDANLRWDGAFSRFDIYQGQGISLELSWQIVSEGGRKIQPKNRILVVQDLADSSIETTVGVLSTALERIADDIAAHLQSLVRESPPR